MVCQLLVLLHALRVFVVCLGVVCRFRWFLLFSSDFTEYIGFGASGGGPRGVKLTMPFSQKAIEFFCPKTSALCGYHVWFFGEMYCFFLKSVKSELRFWVSVVIPAWFFVCFFRKIDLVFDFRFAWNATSPPRLGCCTWCCRRSIFIRILSICAHFIAYLRDFVLYVLL